MLSLLIEITHLLRIRFPLIKLESGQSHSPEIAGMAWQIQMRPPLLSKSFSQLSNKQNHLATFLDYHIWKGQRRF